MTDWQALLDGAMADEAAVDRVQAQARLDAARDMPADTYAQSLTDARAAGLDEAVGPMNPEAVRRAALERYTRETLDAAPALRKWLGATESNAAVAHDDLGPLSQIEQAFQESPVAGRRAQRQAQRVQATDGPSIVEDVTTQYQVGQDQMERARLGYLDFLGSATDADLARLAELSSPVRRPPEPEFWIGQAAQSAPMTSAILLQGVRGALEGGSIGAAAGALAGPAAPVTVPTVALAGAGAMGTARMVVESYQIETGLAFAEYTAIVDEFGQPLDRGAARLGAVLAGAASAGLEIAGLRTVLRTIPGADRLLGTLGRQGVGQLLQTPTVRQAFTDIAARYAGAIGAEAVTEALQELSQAAGQQVAQAVDGGDFEDVDVTAIAQRMLQAGVAAGQATVFFAAPGTAVSVPVEMARVRRAQEDQAVFDALATGAAESRTLARAPQAVQDFVATMTQGGGRETMYVDPLGWSTYFQSQGLDPLAVADELVDGGRDALQEALDTRGSWAVPTATYAARMAGTEHHAEISRHSTFDPEGLTFYQAAEYQGGLVDEIMADLDRVTAQFDREAANLQARERIASDVRSSLQDATASIEEATQAAELWGAAITTLAERAGVDPLDLWQQYRPQIEGPVPPVVRRSVDSLDLMIGRFRAGETEAAVGQGPTLMAAVRAEGGIVDVGGELRAMEVDSNRRPGERPLIRERGEAAQEDAFAGAEDVSDRSYENVLRSMVGQGFFPDLEGRDLGSLDARAVLLDAFEEEISGRPRRLTDAAQQRRRELGRDVDQFREWLASLGFDESATDAEIREAVNRAMADAAGVTFDQQQPVAVLTGNELGDIGDDLRSAQAAADAWYRDNLQGRTIIASDGRQVRMTKLGRRKIRHRLEPTTARHVPAIEAVLERGRYEGFNPDRKQDRQGIVGYHRYVGDVRVGDRTSRVRLLVRETSNGEFFYDLYQQEAPSQTSGLNRPEKEGASEAPSTDPGSNRPGADETFDQEVISQGPFVNLQVDRGPAPPRGSITIPIGGIGARPSVIRLYESRNLSTFLHESGHFFLELMRELAMAEQAPQQIVDDWQAILDWMEVPDGMAIAAPQHELWARTFEAYLFEGRAPSVALQGAFERFRAWLVHVYRRLANLRANLTPEIRDVMDRMLASDAEIEVARDTAAAAAAFDPGTAVAQGLMTESEARAYAGIVERARADAHREMVKRMVAYKRREATDEYEAAREEVTEEVSARVNRLPAYRALEWIANGRWIGEEGAAPTAEWKLSKEILDDEYPGYRQQLPGPRNQTQNPVSSKLLWTRDGGVHPDVIGAWFGYADGAALLDDLAQVAVRREQLIERDVDAQLRERFGDLVTSGQAEREAVEAVHSDTYGRQLEIELSALSRQTPLEGGEFDRAAAGRGRTRVTSRQAAREAARRMIGRMRVSQATRPGRFLQAERLAGRDAMRAIAAGDLVAAREAKHRQLLNNALYVQSRRAEEEVGRALRLVKAVNKRSVRQRLGQDYVDQIDAILDAYQFAARPLRRQASMRGLLEFVARMEAEGVEVAIPDEVLAEAQRDRQTPHYSQISVDQLRGVVDAVRHIKHLGERKNELRIRQDRQKFRDVVAEVVGQIEAEAPRSELPLGSRTDAEARQSLAASWGISLLNADSILRTLDGFENLGPVYRHIKGEIDKAISDRLLPMQDRAAEQLRDLFAGYEPREQRRMSRKTVRVQLGGLPVRLAKWDVIALALNWGNSYNREAVLEGYGASDAEVWAIFQQYMDARDWRFVQSAWDALDSYWGEIAALERRTTGLEPERVEVSPVVSPQGETLARGGYYPVSFDPQLAQRAQENRDAGETLGLLPGSRARAQTRHGHTKERRATGGMPVLLDISVLPQHLNQVVYDLAMREAVTYADRVLKARDVREVFTRTGNLESYRALDLWLKDVAASERGPSDAPSRLFRRLRTGYTIAVLGWSFTTAVIQPTGYLQTSVVIGKRYAAQGLYDVIRQPVRSFQEVLAQSQFMQRRTQTFNRDVFDTIRGIKNSRIETGLQRFALSGFWMISRVQLAVDIATWLGAYRRGMAEQKDVALARQYADRMVARAQGSGLMSDRSAWERGTISQTTRQSEAIKLWTMLGSYMIAKLNVAIERTRQTNFRDPVEAFGWGVDMMILFTIEGILVQLSRGWWPDDEDDTPWYIEALGLAARETAVGVTGGMPIVREFASAAQGFAGGGPVGSVGDVAGSLFHQVMQGEVDAPAIKAGVMAVAVAKGVPGATQANRAIDAFFRDLEGEDVAPIEYVMGRPPR